MRFGDLLPDPKVFPRGVESIRAVVDRLNEAGILAGLHTYSFFIDKKTPWVTPVPDRRLASAAEFTLAGPISADDTTIPVVEDTSRISTITGTQVRNSVTLRIDDELIRFSGVSKTRPFSFTGCERGAYGTRVASHAEGATAYHLRELFGMFVPDGESTLFTEVAARTADMFNRGGFDMLYLDALDGKDAVAGRELGWHYGAKFVYEVSRRLERPAIMEMSSMTHHLWAVRSRDGAWDHPKRGHKRFIDLHCEATEKERRSMLPLHLGWWRFETRADPFRERTFDDDVEYLCAKAIGHDAGISIMGIDPQRFAGEPALARLAGIVRRYETLRREGAFDEDVKARLRVPGREHTLESTPDGGWRLREARYERHTVAGRDASTETWKVESSFDAQPVRFRIEALSGAGPYDAESNPTLADFTDMKSFGAPRTQEGLAAELISQSERVKAGSRSGRLKARGRAARTDDAWVAVEKRFSKPLDLSKTPALGVWVRGDGKGQRLNLQLKSPPHLSRGIADHYIDIDFKGWRYFELIEPDARRYAEHAWPHGDRYSIYREAVRRDRVASLSLLYNGVPPGGGRRGRSVAGSCAAAGRDRDAQPCPDRRPQTPALAGHVADRSGARVRVGRMSGVRRRRSGAAPVRATAEHAGDRSRNEPGAAELGRGSRPSGARCRNFDAARRGRGGALRSLSPDGLRVPRFGRCRRRARTSDNVVHASRFTVCSDCRFVR